MKKIIFTVILAAFSGFGAIAETMEGICPQKKPDFTFIFPLIVILIGLYLVYLVKKKKKE